jgi:hypothetical protein
MQRIHRSRISMIDLANWLRGSLGVWGGSKLFPIWRQKVDPQKIGPEYGKKTTGSEQNSPTAKDNPIVSDP